MGLRKRLVAILALELAFVLVGPHRLYSEERSAPPSPRLKERIMAFHKAMEEYQDPEAIAPYFRPARPGDGAPNANGLWRLLARRIARIERPTVIAVRYEKELGAWIAQTETQFRTCTEDVLKLERAQTVFFLWIWQKAGESLPFEWFISDLRISSAPPTNTKRQERPCPILASAGSIAPGSFSLLRGIRWRRGRGWRGNRFGACGKHRKFPDQHPGLVDRGADFGRKRCKQGF